MRFVLLVLAAAASAPALAEPNAPAAPDAAAIERGRAFAEANCSACHAIGPEGESPYAPAPPFRTLPSKYDVEGLAEAFAEGIEVGHRGERQMPNFVLTPEQIDDLIAYLKSLS